MGGCHCYRDRVPAFRDWVGLPMHVDNFQKGVGVFLHFSLADSVDCQKLLPAVGPNAGHLPQGPIMEDGIRRQVCLIGERLTFFPKRLEQL